MEEKEKQYLWVLSGSYAVDGKPYLMKADIYRDKQDAKRALDSLHEMILNKEHRDHKMISKTETDDSFYAVIDANGKIYHWCVYINEAIVR